MKNVLLAFILCTIVPFVNAQSISGENYVIVIGAFSVKENADRFSKQGKQQKLNAKVEINKLKNLYYVYVMQTTDHDAAMAEVVRLRSATSFKDAWAFNGTLGDLIVAKEEPKPEPVVEKIVEVPKEEPKVIEPIQVTVIDPKVAREEQIKKEVDSKPMVMEKGKKEVLDHIYFFKDAAVLRPESRFAVDKLVKIMKENPAEKIRIHGHTNGDAPGKIIMRADEKSDFFSLDNTVEDYGSAKKLSEQRANLIRDYLIANGIDGKRMTIKAEGGKKPIFDIDDDKAEANVRVEIEVLAE
ncbi:MAG TPA: OmpA family protein [Cyclobacteriaceae bacterium]|nr:OmpA family protein [Cyclobacteriaceae bacterium]